MSMSDAFTTSLLSGNTAVNQSEQGLLDQAPAEMRPYLEAQMKMQKEQEITDYITRMLKSDHEQSMTVIKNIGG